MRSRSHTRSAPPPPPPPIPPFLAAKVEQLFKLISDYVTAHNLSIQAMVDMFDFHQEGGLDYRELSIMLSALLPDVPRMNLRRLVRQFQIADVDNDNRISYKEMMHALGFVVSTSCCNAVLLCGLAQRVGNSLSGIQRLILVVAAQHIRQPVRHVQASWGHSSSGVGLGQEDRETDTI